ncbi:MAG: Fic family protein [Nitriliruptoraceae bacterium]
MSGPDTPRFQRSPHLVALIGEVERLATRVLAAPPERRTALRADRQLAAARASLRLDGARMDTITDRAEAEATVLEHAVDVDGGEVATSAASRATWLDTLRVLDDPQDELVGALELLGVLAADDSDAGEELLTDAEPALASLHRLLTRGLVAPERAGALRGLEQAVHDGATGRILYRTARPATLPREFGLLAVWLTSTGAREHGLIASGVLHLELLRLHPFDAANGRLARSASRAVLGARGLDPDHLAVPEIAMAADPLGYHEEVARTLLRRDLTVWLERWAEAVAEGLRTSARALDVLPAAAPARARDFVRGHEAFTIADYRAEVAAAPEEARAELAALLDAGLVQRVPASRGLRFVRAGAARPL